ncbi:hypothetical protein EDC04DRAFT_2600601 [Pisolithus marmoratus]|nr:hypothetical protein EDC04DRAFT_2600601 [Pisolithus marmoratus]
MFNRSRSTSSGKKSSKDLAFANPSDGKIMKPSPVQTFIGRAESIDGEPNREGYDCDTSSKQSRICDAGKAWKSRNRPSYHPSAVYGKQKPFADTTAVLLKVATPETPPVAVEEHLGVISAHRLFTPVIRPWYNEPEGFDPIGYLAADGKLKPDAKQDNLECFGFGRRQGFIWKRDQDQPRLSLACLTTPLHISVPSWARLALDVNVVGFFPAGCSVQAEFGGWDEKHIHVQTVRAEEFHDARSLVYMRDEHYTIDYSNSARDGTFERYRMAVNQFQLDQAWSCDVHKLQGVYSDQNVPDLGSHGT